MHTKKRFHLRVISAVLAACFLSGELRAAPIEITSPQTSAEQVLLHPDLFETPGNFSTLSEIRPGNGNAFIIHIQDAHSNFSGQDNLANTLDELMKKYGVSLVLSEGGSGDCSLTPMKSITTPQVWKRVARSFLMNGELHGEEYLNLISDRPMKIIGIEDWPLYNESLENYRVLAEKREAILGDLERFRRAIDKLESKLYPKEVLAHERLKKDGSIEKTFKSFLGLSTSSGFDLRTFSELPKLAALFEKEATINFEAANLEQAALVEELSQKGAADDLESSLQKISQMKGQKVALFTHFQNTLKIAKEKGVDVERFRNFLAYVDYLRDFSGIDFDKILTEYDRAEDALYAAILPTDDAKALRSIDRFVGLLTSAHEIKMTADQYALLKKNEPDFGVESMEAFLNRKLAEQGYYEDLIPAEPLLDEGRKALDAFYDSVARRDMAFIKNAEEALKNENQKVAVLITGGYHTPHLKQLFNDKGFGYAVLTPTVTSETNQRKYESLLLSENSKPTKKIEFSEGHAGSADKALSAQEKDLAKLMRKKNDGLRVELAVADPSAARLSKLADAAGARLSLADIRRLFKNPVSRPQTQLAEPLDKPSEHVRLSPAEEEVIGKSERIAGKLRDNLRRAASTLVNVSVDKDYLKNMENDIGELTEQLPLTKGPWKMPWSIVTKAQRTGEPEPVSVASLYGVNVSYQREDGTVVGLLTEKSAADLVWRMADNIEGRARRNGSIVPAVAAEVYDSSRTAVQGLRHNMGRDAEYLMQIEAGPEYLSRLEDALSWMAPGVPLQRNAIGDLHNLVRENKKSEPALVMTAYLFGVEVSYQRADGTIVKTLSLDSARQLLQNLSDSIEKRSTVGAQPAANASHLNPRLLVKGAEWSLEDIKTFDDTVNRTIQSAIKTVSRDEQKKRKDYSGPAYDALAYLVKELTVSMNRSIDELFQLDDTGQFYRRADRSRVFEMPDYDEINKASGGAVLMYGIPVARVLYDKKKDLLHAESFLTAASTARIREIFISEARSNPLVMKQITEGARLSASLTEDGELRRAGAQSSEASRSNAKEGARLASLAGATRPANGLVPLAENDLGRANYKKAGISVQAIRQLNGMMKIILSTNQDADKASFEIERASGETAQQTAVVLAGYLEKEGVGAQPLVLEVLAQHLKERIESESRITKTILREERGDSFRTYSHRALGTLAGLYHLDVQAQRDATQKNNRLIAEETPLDGGEYFDGYIFRPFVSSPAFILYPDSSRPDLESYPTNLYLINSANGNSYKMTNLSRYGKYSPLVNVNNMHFYYNGDTLKRWNYFIDGPLVYVLDNDTKAFSAYRIYLDGFTELNLNDHFISESSDPTLQYINPAGEFTKIDALRLDESRPGVIHARIRASSNSVQGPHGNQELTFDFSSQWSTDLKRPEPAQENLPAQLPAPVKRGLFTKFGGAVRGMIHGWSNGARLATSAEASAKNNEFRDRLKNLSRFDDPLAEINAILDEISAYYAGEGKDATHLKGNIQMDAVRAAITTYRIWINSINNQKDQDDILAEAKLHFDGYIKDPALKKIFPNLSGELDYFKSLAKARLDSLQSTGTASGAGERTTGEPALAVEGIRKDYYRTLGVSQTADSETIKKSYRRLAMRYHPDRNPNDKASEEKFKQVAEAYEVLGEAENRAYFDRYGVAPPSVKASSSGARLAKISDPMQKAPQIYRTKVRQANREPRSDTRITGELSAYKEMLESVVAYAEKNGGKAVFVYPFAGADPVPGVVRPVHTLTGREIDFSEARQIAKLMSDQGIPGWDWKNLTTGTKNAMDPVSYDFLKEPGRGPAILLLKGFAWRGPDGKTYTKREVEDVFKVLFGDLLKNGDKILILNDTGLGMMNLDAASLSAPYGFRSVRTVPDLRIARNGGVFSVANGVNSFSFPNSFILLEKTGARLSSQNVAQASMENPNSIFSGVVIRGGTEYDRQAVLDSLYLLAFKIPEAHARVLKKIEIKQPEKGFFYRVFGRVYMEKPGTITVYTNSGWIEELDHTLTHELGHLVAFSRSKLLREWNQNEKRYTGFFRMVYGAGSSIAVITAMILLSPVNILGLFAAQASGVNLWAAFPVLYALNAVGIIASHQTFLAPATQIFLSLIHSPKRPFVSPYAMTNTHEDFAEFYSRFAMDREGLMKDSRKKGSIELLIKYRIMSKIFDADRTAAPATTVVFGARLADQLKVASPHPGKLVMFTSSVGGRVGAAEFENWLIKQLQDGREVKVYAPLSEASVLSGQYTPNEVEAIRAHKGALQTMQGGNWQEYHLLDGQGVYLSKEGAVIIAGTLLKGWRDLARQSEPVDMGTVGARLSSDDKDQLVARVLSSDILARIQNEGKFIAFLNDLLESKSVAVDDLETNLKSVLWILGDPRGTAYAPAVLVLPYFLAAMEKRPESALDFQFSKPTVDWLEGIVERTQKELDLEYKQAPQDRPTPHSLISIFSAILSPPLSKENEMLLKPRVENVLQAMKEQGSATYRQFVAYQLLHQGMHDPRGFGRGTTYLSNETIDLWIAEKFAGNALNMLEESSLDELTKKTLQWALFRTWLSYLDDSKELAAQIAAHKPEQIAVWVEQVNKEDKIAPVPISKLGLLLGTKILQLRLPVSPEHLFQDPSKYTTELKAVWSIHGSVSTDERNPDQLSAKIRSFSGARLAAGQAASEIERHLTDVQAYSKADIRRSEAQIRRLATVVERLQLPSAMALSAGLVIADSHVSDAAHMNEMGWLGLFAQLLHLNDADFEKFLKISERSVVPETRKKLLNNRPTVAESGFWSTVLNDLEEFASGRNDGWIGTSAIYHGSPRTSAEEIVFGNGLILSPKGDKNSFSFDRRYSDEYTRKDEGSPKDGIVFAFDAGELAKLKIKFDPEAAEEEKEISTISGVPLLALTLESKREVYERFKTSDPEKMGKMALALGYASTSEMASALSGARLAEQSSHDAKLILRLERNIERLRTKIADSAQWITHWPAEFESSPSLERQKHLKAMLEEHLAANVAALNHLKGQGSSGARLAWTPQDSEDARSTAKKLLAGARPKLTEIKEIIARITPERVLSNDDVNRVLTLVKEFADDARRLTDVPPGGQAFIRTVSQGGDFAQYDLVNGITPIYTEIEFAQSSEGREEALSFMLEAIKRIEVILGTVEAFSVSDKAAVPLEHDNRIFVDLSDYSTGARLAAKRPRPTLDQQIVLIKEQIMGAQITVESLEGRIDNGARGLDEALENADKQKKSFEKRLARLLVLADKKKPANEPTDGARQVLDESAAPEHGARLAERLRIHSAKFLFMAAALFGNTAKTNEPNNEIVPAAVSSHDRGLAKLHDDLIRATFGEPIPAEPAEFKGSRKLLMDSVSGARFSDKVRTRTANLQTIAEPAVFRADAGSYPLVLGARLSSEQLGASDIQAAETDQATKLLLAQLYISTSKRIFGKTFHFLFDAVKRNATIRFVESEGKVFAQIYAAPNGLLGGLEAVGDPIDLTGSLESAHSLKLEGAASRQTIADDTYAVVEPATTAGSLGRFGLKVLTKLKTGQPVILSSVVSSSSTAQEIASLLEVKRAIQAHYPKAYFEFLDERGNPLESLPSDPLSHEPAAKRVFIDAPTIDSLRLAVRSGSHYFLSVEAAERDEKETTVLPLAGVFIAAILVGTQDAKTLAQDDQAVQFMYRLTGIKFDQKKFESYANPSPEKLSLLDGLAIKRIGRIAIDKMLQFTKLALKAIGSAA